MGVAQSKFGTFVGAAAVICAAANAKGRAIASVGVDSDAKVSSTKDTIEAKPKCPHGHTKEQNMSAAGTANVAAAQFLGTGKDASQTLLSPSRQSSSDHEFVSQRGHKGVYYHDYLKLDLILGAQAPKSQELGGKMAHEEMLFVIIHQTYELWFKQVLHDLDSCRGFLRLNFVPEYALGTVSRRLSRITLILHQLVNQLGILETMTPLDFLDFRDFLFPASGFQSVQFRLLENALGLRHDHRLQYAKNDYCSRLSEPHKDVVLDSEKSDSLFELIQRWLERTPFLESQDYDFWSAYEKAVGKMFNAERSALLKAPVSEEERATQLKELEHTENSFRVIFDEARYNEELKSNRRRLSFKANKAAILISLYRDQPIFQMPHQILMLLVDIDGLLTQWRERHAQMVHRMLGAKIGTGGSSGYHYLKATAGRHKIFSDFSNLSMFLIPRSALPRLPPSIVERDCSLLAHRGSRIAPSAMGILEKIKAIEEEYARTQKNKATEYHLGQLKAKLAKLRTQLIEGTKSGGGKPGAGFDVTKTGDARIAMVGFPSVGKSTILSTMTKTESIAASYEFTTLTCIPGIIEYKECKIQLLDLPGIIEGASKGMGRGRQVIGVARSADIVLMVLDAEKAEVQKRLLTKELYDVNIRLNQKKPNIALKLKKTGGVKFNSVVELTHMDEKLCRSILSLYRIHNCDILFRGDYGADELIDVIEGNRVYMKCVYCINKVDTLMMDQVDRLARQPHTVLISCNWKLNLDGLLESMWEHMDMIRIYTKKRSERPMFKEPVILKRGSTIKDVCMGVHQDFYLRFKYAAVWGTSARHCPQRVGLSHVLNDEDVVQLMVK